jgi:hypothetical protein
MSGVHDSTAAENVCRLQTLATVGSPGISVSVDKIQLGWGKILLTGKDVFMNPCELDIRLG